METLKKFIAGSSSFCAFSFQGRYDMDEDMFLKLYDHYLKTGRSRLILGGLLHLISRDMKETF
jgi:hypothetical protein